MKSPPELVRKTPTRVTAKLDYEVITPMMGGGAKPREADEVTTVRASSVLGQLRFWWRACRANGFQDLQSLRAREDEIWGTMSRPSAVQLSVQCTKQGVKEEGFSFASMVTPAYGAFPLQSTKGQVRSGIQFTLTLVYPIQIKGEIESALWAWTVFGGIGARTRRGFGTLRLVNDNLGTDWSPNTRNELLSLLPKWWQRYVTASSGESRLSQVPRLPDEPSFGKYFAVGESPGVCKTIWLKAIACLRNVRQKRKPGGNPTDSGRSFWPEPDSIRRATKEWSPGHEPASKLDGFPRACYGLPIVFHFKDPKDPKPDCTLMGNKHDRRASPLILKPFVLKSGQCLSMALLLKPNDIPPDGLALRRGQVTVVNPPKFDDWATLAKVLGVPKFAEGPFAPVLDSISRI